MNCRRCGRAFGAPPAGMRMASCPHCGAAVRPLVVKFRDNRNAAVLAVVALPVLTAGLVLPFLSIAKLGHERAASLVSAIGDLYGRGYYVLASILLAFSVVFPYAKLLAILVATSGLVPISAEARVRLHHVAHLTGKYSLLDLLVVAIMIVLVKFEGLAEVRALAGTTLFAVAVFLSIAAGFAVDADGLGRARGARRDS